MEPLRKTLIISTCVTHVCRSRSSWYRISRLLAGWLGGPRSSCHTNSWWTPPRPDGLSHGSHLPGWCAGNRLHRSKRSTNYCRGAGKTPEFFKFRFRTFLGRNSKRQQRQFDDFYEFMSLKSIRFYRWSSGLFHNVLKHGVFFRYFSTTRPMHPQCGNIGDPGTVQVESLALIVYFQQMWVPLTSWRMQRFFPFFFVRLTKVWLCWEVWKITPIVLEYRSQ